MTGDGEEATKERWERRDRGKSERERDVGESCILSRLPVNKRTETSPHSYFLTRENGVATERELKEHCKSIVVTTKNVSKKKPNKE